MTLTDVARDVLLFRTSVAELPNRTYLRTMAFTCPSASKRSVLDDHRSHTECDLGAIVHIPRQVKRGPDLSTPHESGPCGFRECAANAIRDPRLVHAHQYPHAYRRPRDNEHNHEPPDRAELSPSEL